MKIVGVIVADLVDSPLGTASRQSTELHGFSVLRRTVVRVLRSSRLCGAVVACPKRDEDRCHELLGGLDVRIRSFEGQVNAFSKLVSVARKWSVDGWRGGLGGVCVLDEYFAPNAAAEIARRDRADGVMMFGGSWPLVDPVWIDLMIDHYEREGRERRMTFAQAPPGLVGCVYDTELICEMAEKSIPPGWLLSYKPDSPTMDLAFKPACCATSVELRHSFGRASVDTSRSFDRVERILTEHNEPDAETVARWLSHEAASFTPVRPREVEIELTTDDQQPRALLQPRGEIVPPRGFLKPATLERLIDELAEDDDALVTFGGFGEPFLHPQFERLLEQVKCPERGIFGVAIQTNGLMLDERWSRRLIECGIDVVAVMLDAWTSETYTAMRGDHSLEMVSENIKRFQQLRSEAGAYAPAIVPVMTKARENVHELDAFFDGWIGEVGAASIVGHAHRSMQVEDHAVMSMAPATRAPCRRIHGRCVVLADGRVTACDQDFRGLYAMGSLEDSNLSAIWGGERFVQLRCGQGVQDYEVIPLCAKCDEWHRR
jgi:sulfatase maturation enzyme AslB (radical SAM superfamily)